jgi:hypothetical protein
MNKIDISALSNEPRKRQVQNFLDVGEILAAFRGSFGHNIRIIKDLYFLKSFEIVPPENSLLHLRINGESCSLFLPTDKAIGMKVFFDQCWDPRKIKFFQLIAQNLGDEVTVVDVGANVGLFTRQCMSYLSDRGAAFCYRTPQRGVQTTDKNPDRSAEPRYRGDAALGFVGVRTNPNAKGQWMGALGSANPTCHA